jgi:hypothetical protein
MNGTGEAVFGQQEPKKEIKAILELNTTERIQLKQVNFDNSLLETRLKDINWRVKTRANFGFAMLGLLFLQNAIVFGLVITAYFRNNLKELEIIFGILVPSTLLETAYAIKIIIEWLFKDIDYTVKNH